MRNVERIKPFCETLVNEWSKVPDLRFGQLMMDILAMYVQEYGNDYFYAEDDEMIKVIKKFVGARGN